MCNLKKDTYTPKHMTILILLIESPLTVLIVDPGVK